MTRLDGIDKKLFNRLQTEFPLTGKPFADLGLGLGIAEEEVIRRTGQLKANGLIRQIGPIVDARSLGYKTTLVAMKVMETQLDQAAHFIRAHPGISHGYERDNAFNLWLTLAVPATVDIEAELQRLASAVPAETAFSLPAVRVFKLRAYFALSSERKTETAAINPDRVQRRDVELSPADRIIINELQQDLPLVPEPFAAMAAKLGMDEAKFLERCRSLQSRGIVRRFSAAVNHRKAGFKANAMTCWTAPPEKVVAAGKRLASLREVSHCYERKVNPLWRYNLFAMIHAMTRDECQEIVDKVSAETGLTDYVMLFSTRELKKTRVKYLV
jgi:DNA-binding Lrp family transcriptional regulator